MNSTQYAREYRKTSKGKMVGNKASKKYYKAHKAQRAEYDKKHNQLLEIKEQKRKMMVEYRKSDKYQVYIKEYRKQYRLNNKEKLSIIDMEKQLKRKRNTQIIENVNKSKLRQMYDNKCVWCGDELGDIFHIDHLLSVARHKNIGKKCPHSYDNCVPSCVSCNESKQDKTPLEFLWWRKSEVGKEVLLPV